MKRLSRRMFMSATPAVALSALLAPEQRAAAHLLGRLEGGPSFGESYPSQDPQIVQMIVGAAHTKLDEVTSLVKQRPALARASWDWGFGDWESALGAASHVGRRDIAEVLLAHGARANLFTFAMLGQVDVVRAICTAHPGIQRTPGPHGITLLKHAVAGEDEAHDVVEYLTALGGADESPANLPVDEAAAKPYVAQYEPIGMPHVRLSIAWSDKRQGLMLSRDDRSARFLLNEGGHVFHPVGAPDVSITFSVIEDLALDMTIIDGDHTLIARRVN
ncbi:MAG: hypothetical protein IT430_18235 [Phycisphaerales bacterium]|nr:hypothetical protein [Phycisphaerales bacterium]